jgi:hypothetical protein
MLAKQTLGNRIMSLREVILLTNVQFTYFICTVLFLMLPSVTPAQMTGLEPLPIVAGVPFHSNVFGEAATAAAESKISTPKAVLGAPQDVYTGHASVFMWEDADGHAQYSAAVALHSVTFAMSKSECGMRNGGDTTQCELVYDDATPVLAVIKASDNGFFFAKGLTWKEAKKNGMAACASRANVTCKVDKVFGERGGLFDR